MGVFDLVQAMSALPQIMESVKKMSAADMEAFLEQLGLSGQEKEEATGILKAFQQEKELTRQEQINAQCLLDKALQMNDLDMETIINLGTINQETNK